MTFERTLFAGWGDMDFNSHMRNTAFLDKAADVRVMFLADRGFSAAELHRLRIGPVVMKDELEYYREVGLLAPLRVTYLNAGLSDDVSRFRVRNEFWREDGQLAARVTSTGGWMDLNARKIIVPPDPICEAIRSLTRTDDFVVLPSSIR